MNGNRVSRTTQIRAQFDGPAAVRGFHAFGYLNHGA